MTFIRTVTHVGCRCGAVSATPAAYAQMTQKQKDALLDRAISCATCARDGKAARRVS